MKWKPCCKIRCRLIVSAELQYAGSLRFFHPAMPAVGGHRERSMYIPSWMVMSTQLAWAVSPLQDPQCLGGWLYLRIWWRSLPAPVIAGTHQPAWTRQLWVMEMSRTGWERKAEELWGNWCWWLLPVFLSRDPLRHLLLQPWLALLRLPQPLPGMVDMPKLLTQPEKYSLATEKTKLEWKSRSK